MLAEKKGNLESSISGEALDLLDCFANGLDDVMYELAEAVAARRTGRTENVEICVSDIREAAGLFMQCLEQVDVPDRAKAAVHEMLKCLSHRIDKDSSHQ